MIQQDYFLRLIEEFAVALAKMLKVNLDKRDDALMDLYRQYVGDYTLVRNLSFEELLDYATKEWNDRERIDRLEMFAELLYAEASYKANPLRDMLYGKAFEVFSYVDAHHGVYSIERKKKINQLSALLKK